MRTDESALDALFPRVPLRTLSRIPIVSGVGQSAQPYDPKETRFIRTTDIETRISLKSSTRRSLPRVFEEKAPLERWDLLLSTAGTIGKSYLHVIDEESSCFAGFLARVRPRSSEEARYLSYWTATPDFLDQVSRGAVVSTIANFSAGRYRGLQVPFPADGIALRPILRYLDHAELRIARAIKAKLKLTELLREQKAAVCEAAVLGGFTHSKFRETGLPWAPRIPDHWDLAPVRSALSPRREIVGNRHAEHTLLSLTLQGVIVRDLTTSKGKFPASFESYQQVHSGDFVLCLFDVDETPRTVGRSGHDGMITGA